MNIKHIQILSEAKADLDNGSKRFPYSIYYDLEGITVYVIALLPERINPNWVRSKLGKKS